MIICKTLQAHPYPSWDPQPKCPILALAFSLRQENGICAHLYCINTSDALMLPLGCRHTRTPLVTGPSGSWPNFTSQT